MPHSIQRRNVLRGALAFGAAAAGRIWPSSAASAGQFTGKIRKAVKYQMIKENLSISDKFKLLKDLGFDGVEPGTVEKNNRAQLLKASEVTGVKVHGIVNSKNPDIKTAIDLAKYLGATSVLLVVPANPTGSYLENYRQRQEIIRRAIPHAEKEGIKLLIENVWASFLIEPLSMARFVDELNSRQVGVYFDVGNNIRWGYAAQWIEVLGKRIGKLDIKEYSRKLQQSEGLRAGFKPKLGDGSVDWKRVREELAKLDFQGWATAEVPGGDRHELADIAHRMDRVLDL